ncbi:MlaA family lipoprotein [Derxia gummosa]|uniref:MlaA family lipoprotein n=1 Tax=Derxia gummosa DSM 723 TaxID=1121388 RepID=A0A9U5C6G5_9BURK|nr:VacJ family lipoprotein [Derxia gummosa]
MTAPDSGTHAGKTARRATAALAPVPRPRHAPASLPAALAALALAGCATTGARSAPNPADPWEGFNRPVYNFNEKVDRYVMKPVAEGYRAVVPEPVRDCVSNMFSNVGDLWSGVNSLLQGKPADTAHTVMRFGINTLFGFGGCADVASTLPGLQRRPEDFGQTLGVWGLGSGPYLVLPFFGPSSARDGVGFVVDRFNEPFAYLDDNTLYWSLSVTRVISLRAELLDAKGVLDNASFDAYAFTRDAYLQRRRSLVYDGNPPNAAPSYDDEEDDAPAN